MKKTKIRDMTAEQRRAYGRRMRRARALKRAERSRKWNKEQPLRQRWYSWEEAYRLAFQHVVASARISRLSPEQLVAYCVKAADAYVSAAEARRPKIDA